MVVMVSAIWWPMVKTGSKAVAGSWKIIAAALPRIDAICRFFFAVITSMPLSSSLSALIVAVLARSRISARQVTGLSRSRTPHDAEAFAVLEAEIDAAHGFHFATVLA